MDEKLPQGDRLYQTNEEFFACLDEGVKLMQQPLLSQEPHEEDKMLLKGLLATYITGVFDADRIGGPGADPQLKEKMTVIRLTLLAGYNLGRMRGKFSAE